MLALEVPNLHELDLDRVIAYGHTWSPTLELTPEIPMFHGHSVAIDMAFSATIAQLRGYISIAERDRILGLMSRLGLAIDSPYLHQNCSGKRQHRSVVPVMVFNVLRLRAPLVNAFS
jgi:3-dehydroquinate synthetase